MVTPSMPASSRTDCCVSGSPRGDMQSTGQRPDWQRLSSIANRRAGPRTSARMTIPAPPPTGVSSTDRCRPMPNRRRSIVSSSQIPCASALPERDCPSVPGNASGRRVMTFAHQVAAWQLSFDSLLSAVNTSSRCWRFPTGFRRTGRHVSAAPSFKIHFGQQ